MAIEYWLEMECPVREQLGADRFKDMLQTAADSHRHADHSCRRRDARSGSPQAGLAAGAMSPAGKEIMEQFTIGKTLDETRILDVLVDHCKKCPANLAEGYGLLQPDKLPDIGLREHWLAAVSKAAGERKDTANIPVRVIFDKKLKGAPFARMRRELGPRAFETGRIAPDSFRQGPFKGRSVRTDQVLDVMFLNAEIKGSFLQSWPSSRAG